MQFKSSILYLGVEFKIRFVTQGEAKVFLKKIWP